MAGPKLLDKKIVNAEVATQKKNLIDSGLKIAKKVDAVRETLQTEEKNLEEFRAQSIKRVQVDIDQHIKVLDDIKLQIKDRREELTQLQLPLNQKWEEVNKAQAICNDWSLELDRKEHHLDGRQTLIENSEREIDIEKGRITEMKRITVDKLNHADDNLERAREESANIRNKAQAVLSSAELREKVVIGEEEQLQSTLVWIEKEKKRLTSWEKDLSKREKVLKDRYATLERTLKRVK